MKTMSVEELRTEVTKIDWWHEIDLGHGIVTSGRGGSRERLAAMEMPEDLTGKTVLDIGAFDGLFSFEAEKRGAKRVVALEHRVPPGFMLARRALGSSVEFVEMDVMEMTPEAIGVFDIVFFMGVLYHLPNPVEGLRRVASVTREMMILETDSSMDWIEAPVAELRGSREAMTNPALNWWIPNAACVAEMTRAVGFERMKQVFGPPPAPKTLFRKVMRRALPRYFGPKSSRLIVHAWK